MKMKLLLHLFFAGFLMAGLEGCTQKLVPQRLNQQFEYKTATAIFHDTRREGDSLHIFLKFNDLALFAFPQNMQLSYAVYADYSTHDKYLMETQPQKTSGFKKTKDAVFTDFKVPAAKLKNQAVLVIRVVSQTDGQNVVYKDIQLTPSVLTKPYVLVQPETGLPFFRNYIKVNETVRVAQAGVAMPGELIHYETDFEAARPPMATQGKTVAPGLKKLGTISFLDQPLMLIEPGLFAVEIGGKAVGGFIVETGSFPEISTAKDLIQPLIYLTTTQERNKLYQASNPKAAVDKFWLDITPNQQEARQLIRIFYERVTAANQLFTAHKAGWQTDRGMIYLIYGPANRVNRFNDREEWLYFVNEDHNETRFVFLKKDNTFTQNYYELLRSPYLEDAWYSMVEQWRKGTIAK